MVRVRCGGPLANMPFADDFTPVGASRARVGCLLGLGVALGWSVHDASVFLTSGQPQAMLELLPGWLAALALAALLGWSFGRWVFLGPLALLVCIALSFDRASAPWLSPATIWLPKAGALMLLAFAAAWLCVMGLRRAPLLTGALAGFAACAALAAYRLPDASWYPLGFAGLVLVASFLPKRGPRWIATLLLLSVATAWKSLDALESTAPSRADLADLPGPASPAAPNLVLVVLDTVRADHLAPYGYARVTTPHLDAFARDEATRFTQARSSSSWTLPSHASLFTGLLPSEHGAAYPGETAHPLRGEVVTLAERLRAAGYETAAVVANTLFIVPRLGMDQGFGHFDDRRGSFVGDYLALPQLAGLRLAVGHTPYRSAREITEAALQWLDARSPSEGRLAARPFFLMLNYMDAHRPYLPPSPFDKAFSDEVPEYALKPERKLHLLLYDRELMHLDSQLARLLERLRERGLFENTVVVVTADHGEAFGEHGRYGHSGTLFEELVHVPLYVKPAGAASGRSTIASSMGQARTT